jgi:hypothetical protein
MNKVRFEYNRTTKKYTDSISRIELVEKKNKTNVLGYIEFDLGRYCNFNDKKVDHLTLKDSKFDGSFEIEVRC